jgi:hypothetical protein
MIEVLRIKDLSERRVLGFDLRDLLDLVADEGPCLHWAAVPMGESTFITGNGGPRDEEAFGLAERVDDSGVCIPLDWHDLVDLSNSILQTIWGTFVGVRNEADLADVPNLFLDRWHYVDRANARFYETVDLAFQAVDSSFWLVWARDDTVRERIRGAFEDVETIPGMARYEPKA